MERSRLTPEEIVCLRRMARGESPPLYLVLNSRRLMDLGYIRRRNGRPEITARGRAAVTWGVDYHPHDLDQCY